jgi:hypothetical protein
MGKKMPRGSDWSIAAAMVEAPGVRKELRAASEGDSILYRVFIDRWFHLDKLGGDHVGVYSIQIGERHFDVIVDEEGNAKIASDEEVDAEFKKR